jgi:O-antigen ligase
LTALILAFGSPKKALLFLLAVSIPLNLDFCVYSRDYLGGLNGVFLSLPDLCIGTLALLLVADSLWNRSKTIALFPRTTLPFMALVLASVLSTAVTVDKTHTLYGIVALAKALMLYFVVANSINSEREARFVFNSLVIGLILAASLYLVQSVFHVSFLATGELRQLAGGAEALGGNIRPGGTLGHPNAASGYFAGMLMVALASLGVRQSILQRVIVLCAIFLGSWALLMTFTRTGWIAFASGFLCLVAVGLKKRVFGGAFFAAVLCLAPIGVMLWGGLVKERMTTNLETYDSRIPLIKQAFYIIGQHPIFGIGANAYGDVVYKYVPEDMGAVWMYTVHNGFLYHWVELGILGFLAFLWLLFSLGREAWALLGAEERAVRAMGLGAFAFLFTEAVFMNGVQWYVFGSSGLSFCMLLALAAFLNTQESAYAVHTHENSRLLASVIKAERPVIA